MPGLTGGNENSERDGNLKIPRVEWFRIAWSQFLTGTEIGRPDKP